MMRTTLLSTLIFVSLLLFAVSCTEEKTSPPAATSDASKDVSQGASIYEAKCLKCHGENGQGGICPNLVDGKWKYGGTDQDLYTSIAKGRPGGMPAWEGSLNEEKIKSIVAYIRSLSAK